MAYHSKKQNETERAVAQVSYVKQSRMRLARQGGLTNFSASVNKRVIDYYIGIAKQRKAEAEAAKQDCNLDNEEIHDAPVSVPDAPVPDAPVSGSEPSVV